MICFLMFCRRDVIIPDKSTMSMLVDGVRYDELPICFIKAKKNNTVVMIADHTGRFCGFDTIYLYIYNIITSFPFKDYFSIQNSIIRK